MHRSIDRRRWLGLCLSTVASSAAAQAPGPTAPLRIIVPFPAGGGVDVLMRAVAEQLQAALGHTVIVDNRPGAAGLIGAKAAAKAPPDGLTCVYLHSGLVTVQALNARLDLLNELRPVARLMVSPLVVVVRADSDYRTLQDLIADVRARPDRVTFGSGGAGSPAHLAVEHLAARLGDFKAVHVPFKGATDTANAIVGGQIAFQIGLVAGVSSLLRGGRLRALAVTSRTRLPQLPDVPTMAEAGVPDFVLEPWGGLAVPAGTPDAAIAQLSRVLPGALGSPSVKELLTRQAGVAAYADAAAFSAQIAREIELERVLVKRLGLTALQ